MRYNVLQLLTRGSPTASRTKSPDPLTKERDDVNKLVSDLIGGSPLPAQPSPAPSVVGVAKSASDVAGSTPSGPTSDRRRTKLVMETLAPVVIRPKVCACEFYCANSFTLS